MKYFYFLEKVDISDILMLLGCILMGYGFFLAKSLGVFLVAIGACALNFGVLRSVLGGKPPKR